MLDALHDLEAPFAIEQVKDEFEQRNSAARASAPLIAIRLDRRLDTLPSRR